MAAHALTGRRISSCEVSAVRTSHVKLCQARAVPVIPPKIQTLRSHSPCPLRAQRERAQPLERNQEEAGSIGGTFQKLTKDDSLLLGKPQDKKAKARIQGLMSPCQWVPLHLTCARAPPFLQNQVWPTCCPLPGGT